MSLLNPKYEYKKLARKVIDGKRHYIDSNTAQALPSVTTILGMTKDMTALNEWKRRVGKVEAQRIVTEAASLGSLMHQHLECYIEGTERPGGTNQVRVQAKQLSDTIIEKGMTNVDEIWGIEQPLMFPGLYAGTADLICQYKGTPVIGDFKTSRKFKKREWIDDYFMQCAAYALAHNEMYGSSINAGLIFIITHDNKYQEFLIQGAEFEKYIDLWLDKVEEYYKIINTTS